MRHPLTRGIGSEEVKLQNEVRVREFAAEECSVRCVRHRPRDHLPGGTPHSGLVHQGEDTQSDTTVVRSGRGRYSGIPARIYLPVYRH